MSTVHSARPLPITISSCLFWITLALSGSHAYSQTFDSGFRFNDQTDQNLFIEAIRKEGIPFSVRKDGILEYSSRDEDRVSKVRFRLLEENYQPSISFTDPQNESRFTAALDASRIQWAIRMREGKRYITWSEDDAMRVDAIINSLFRSQAR